MNPSGSTAGAPAFVQGSPEAFFPLGGAVLLILLLVGAAVLVFWARSRNGAAWRAPWAARQADRTSDAAVPRLLSSLRLDAVHRVHVIAWNNRQILVATGTNVSPVVVASVEAGAAAGTPASVPPEKG